MNNLVVRLSLDNVNFRQGIANSGRAVRTLQNELKSISTGMGGFANASEQTRAKTDALNRLIEAQKKKLEHYAKPMIKIRLSWVKMMRQLNDMLHK